MIKKLFTVVFMACLALALVLAGCGGGNSGSYAGGVGSGGTGSYTNGTVSGLGSIIVNGVRYGIDTAQLVRDDGVVVTDPAALSLGMVVEVLGSAVTPATTAGATATATASKVRWGSLLIGQASAVSLTNGIGSVVVMGQTVQVTAATVMPTVVTDGVWVEVHGLLGAGSTYTASRMDVLGASPATLKLSGVVRGVTALADGRTLSVGAVGSEQSIDCTGACLTGLAGQSIGAGARVRLWVSPTKAPNGHWQGVRAYVEEALTAERDEASVDGLITQLPDASGVMYIEGRQVNVSKIASLPTMAVGDRARAEGSLRSGVLLATELSAGSSVDDESSELHGTVSALDAIHKTFVLKGITIDYSGVTVEGTLSNGACVEVHGTGYNDARQLIATEVHAESCE